MTSQDKKQWLKRYTELNKAINQKVSELDRLRSLAEKVTSTYSDMPKSPSFENHREDTYAKMIDLSKEIDAEIDKYVDMRKEIEENQ